MGRYSTAAPTPMMVLLSMSCVVVHFYFYYNALAARKERSEEWRGNRGGNGGIVGGANPFEQQQTSLPSSLCQFSNASTREGKGESAEKFELFQEGACGN
jgi:hypothetical protein